MIHSRQKRTFLGSLSTGIEVARKGENTLVAQIGCVRGRFVGEKFPLSLLYCTNITSKIHISNVFFQLNVSNL